MSKQNIVLTLFIAGTDPASECTVRILRELCKSEFDCPFELRVIDLLQQPDKAREYKILSIPTLIKQTSQNELRYVGDFSDLEELRNALIGTGLRHEES